jgi:predicted O-methyltransferase YrrM
MTPEDVTLFDYYEKKTDMKDHLLVIYGIVLGLRPKISLEIGVRSGISTMAILLALKRIGSGKLYSIDITVHPKTTDRAMKRARAAGVVSFWNFQQADSFEFWKTWTEPLDILLIDGNHSFEAVKNDFERYSKFVRKDGLILMHDAYTTSEVSSGVVEVNLYMPEIRKRLNEFESVTLPYCYGLTIVRKLT